MTWDTAGARNRKRRIDFLVQRDGGGEDAPARCFYCGCDLDYDVVTFDHVYPRSRGGSNALWNMVIACAPCNVKKADRVPDQVRIPSPRAQMQCRVCKNGRRFPDGENDCWACYRFNPARHRPVRSCNHSRSWCVSCVAV